MPEKQPELSETVATKEARKLKARRDKDRVVWFGLGMFGIIGWSVTVPTLVGIALGIWIDSSFPSRFSWTLMLLIAGLMVGCLNAWYWVSKASKRDEGER